MSDKIRILIAEDDSFQAKNLMVILEERGFFILPIAATYESACRTIDASYMPDIAILDIELDNPFGGKDALGGISIAEYLSEKSHIPIIFLTKHFEDVSVRQRALACKPSAFVDKPLLPKRFFSDIELALTNYSIAKNAGNLHGCFSLNNRLWFPNSTGYHDRVDHSEIIFAHTEHENTKIFTTRRKAWFTMHRSLKGVLREVPLLKQVSKNDAINPGYVEDFDKGLEHLLIRNNFEPEFIKIAVSERFRPEIRKLLKPLR